MKGFEENEISKNANGGTEIAKRKLASIIDEDLLNNFQIICSREREIDESKIRIFWCHDLPEDPESKKFRDPRWRDKYHKFVFISNWQFQRYQLIHGLPADDKIVILESGIEPAPETCFDKPKDKVRIVYASTPQRGLELLIPAFDFLTQHHNNIHLDVFSSFKIYGWDEVDKNFEPLYNQVRNHPNMTYHGFVPNDQLKEHLNKCHIFAYPSIWLETSCRIMLESMSAGLVCVHSNLGALPETSGLLNVMYNFMDNKEDHTKLFASHLNAAIDLVQKEDYQKMTRFNKVYVDSRYNLSFIKSKWEVMLKSLVEKYPTIESRKVSEEMFVYKV